METKHLDFDPFFTAKTLQIWRGLHYSFRKQCFLIASACGASLQKFLKGKSDAYKLLVHFQIGVGVFNCEKILTKISLVIFNVVVKSKSNVV